MIATLIRNLTSLETNRRNRTELRRFRKPAVDLLETRLSPGGGWSTPYVYTPTSGSGTTSPPTMVSSTPTQPAKSSGAATTTI